MILEFFNKNVELFYNLSVNNQTPKIEHKINTIILSLKTSAFEKYNLDLVSIEKIIKEYENKYFSHNEFKDFKDLNIVYQASLFFQSISLAELEQVNKFIELHLNVLNKYATNMVIEHYNCEYFDNSVIDSYLMENIIRILKGLKNILEAEIDINYSTGFGNSNILLEEESILVSISNPDKNDYKIIAISTNKSNIIDPEFCLGGVSERIINLKKEFDSTKLFLSAQSDNCIYIWSPKNSYNPIIICESIEIIYDYDIFIYEDYLLIIALTHNNLIVWKEINNQSFISNKINIPEDGNILININGINKLLKKIRHSKKIYKYNYEENRVNEYFNIPDDYDIIDGLSVHPYKNKIIFSYSDKIEYELLKFDKIVEYNIDTKSVTFSEKVEGHSIYNTLYEVKNDITYLIISDRDGAGNTCSPLFKVWKEVPDNCYNIVYSYDSYPKEKNSFFDFMNLCNNNLIVNMSEETQQLYILKNENIIPYFKLNKGYVITDIIRN